MAKAKKQKGPYLQFGPWFAAQFGRMPLDIASRIRAYDRAEDLVVHARGQMRVVKDEDRMADLCDAAMKGWVAGYEAGNLEARAASIQKTPEELLKYENRRRR